MISSINAGPGLSVINGFHDPTYYNTGLSLAGTVRFYNNSFQVYDGNVWINIKNNDATVKLDTWALEAIMWASNKLKEEKDLETLSVNHPAIKAAYENVKRAKEQLQTTILLSKDVETTD